MKVKIKQWNGVASWLWVANDENCGICRMSFNGCCPDCKLLTRCLLLESSYEPLLDHAKFLCLNKAHPTCINMVGSGDYDVKYMHQI